MIRCKKDLNGAGTVVIHELQMLEDTDRGHRLYRMVARPKYLAPQARFL
jgi:superfamily II helicase